MEFRRLFSFLFVTVILVLGPVITQTDAWNDDHFSVPPQGSQPIYYAPNSARPAWDDFPPPPPEGQPIFCSSDCNCCGCASYKDWVICSFTCTFFCKRCCGRCCYYANELMDKE